MIEIEKYAKLDEDLVDIADDFKILTLVEWPKETQDEFIKKWKAGNPENPKIQYQKYDFKSQLQRLEKIIEGTDEKNAVAQFIHKTAKSYFYAHHMIENLGKPEMTQNSIRVYGKPGDTVAGSTYTNIDAAKFFIETADVFNDDYNIGEEESCILAETLRSQIEEATRAVITGDKVEIMVDDKLVPKAAAGATRVRLRSGTCFSKYDFQQLLQHEVFVHTLTAINGRNQKKLKSLRLGSPRTTATQEGLATFAELVTGSIDLSRLKRIALRVLATDMALRGANFMDTFKFFIAHNQSPSESYSSTQRIFRGGDPEGNVVFTKDSVYLDGLLTAHSFFRWAMKNRRLDLTHVLFAGRMTFEDAHGLAPFQQSGFVAAPKYLPPWIQNFHTLGAYLAFSLFANKIRVDNLDKTFAV